MKIILTNLSYLQKNCLAMMLLLLGSTGAHAQIAITGARLDTIRSAGATAYNALKAPDAADTITTNSLIYKFGPASGYADNAKKLLAFTAGGSGYTYNAPAPVIVKIRRVENDGMRQYRTDNNIPQTVPTPTPRDLAYYEGTADLNTGTVKIKSAYIPKPEDLFLTNDVTIGIDNLFANTWATNFNNIERIDVISAGGIIADVPAAMGFALFERGAFDGHDPSKVALITSLNAAGDPLTYATKIVSVQAGDYYTAGQNTNLVYQPANTAAGNFLILRRDDASERLKLSDLIGANQGIGGVFIRYSDFNIAPGTKVYGYSVMANDFTGTGANVRDYTNPFYFPTDSKDASGIAGNDMATITGVVKLLTIAGNVYNDANGLKDNLVNGIAINNPSAVPLYVNLVNAQGIVVGVAPVQADGSFLFDKLAFGPLTAQLTTNAGTIGKPAALIALPAGWANTGSSFGLNNSSGTGINNVAVPGGTIGVQITDVNITDIKFGIERLPVADPKTAAGMLNPGGTVKVAVPVLTGSDAEDGIYSGNSKTNTIVIDTLPANAVLYYNGVKVTAGQIIPNYDPALLKLDPDNGIITVKFYYSETDAAGKKGLPAPVLMPFTSVLPVKLASFEVRKNVAGTQSLLTWITESEMNSAYFTIQKSVAGIVFSDAGKVNAAGTSVISRHYSFADEQPAAGNNYYRLKITDADGSTAFSDVKMLSFEKGMIMLYPNPATDHVTISEAPMKSTVVIFGTDGKLLHKKVITSRVFNLSTKSIPGGNYFIKIYGDKGDIEFSDNLIIRK